MVGGAPAPVAGTWMARLLEHHTLELLGRGGVAVPRFRVVASPEEAAEAAAALGGGVVIKALIPVGGRGKAGAIRTADGPEQAAVVAGELLGRTVLNFPIERLLVSEPVAIAEELFLSITFDSMSRRPIVLFSARGGIEVEAILERDPDSLIQRPLAPSQGLQPFLARETVVAAGLRGKTVLAVADVLVRLWRIFAALEAQTLEINPLALTA